MLFFFFFFYLFLPIRGVETTIELKPRNLNYEGAPRLSVSSCCLFPNVQKGKFFNLFSRPINKQISLNRTRGNIKLLTTNRSITPRNFDRLYYSEFILATIIQIVFIRFYQHFYRHRYDFRYFVECSFPKYSNRLCVNGANLNDCKCILKTVYRTFE